MELKRTLSLKDAFLLLFTSMVGSGIFFTTGFVLKSAKHPYAVLLCWVIGAVFAIMGAMSYAYPAVMYPHAGGDYIYLRKVYSPLLGFLSGWAALVANFTANIAVLALAFSKHLSFLVPISTSEPLFFIGPIPIFFGSYQWIGLILVWGFTFINLVGVKKALRIQNTLSLLKISGMIVFILLGFSIGKLNWFHFSLDYSNIENPPFEKFEFSFELIKGILNGMIPVSFAFFGWNMVTYVAGEVKEPEIIIPRSIILACSAVGIIYLLMNVLYLGSSDAQTLISSKEGVGVVASIQLFGTNAKFWMSLFILVMILGSLPAMIFAGSRIYYAMAKDKLFFSSLAKLHPKWHTPHNALLFQAVYSSFLILLGDIEKLLYFMTCAILLLSIFTSFIPIYLDWKGVPTVFKIPFFPLPPLIYILGTSFLILYLAFTSPENALSGLAITLAGVPVYFFMKKLEKNSNLDIKSK